MTTEIAMMLLRYGLAALGTWLAAKGWFTTGDWDVVTGAVIAVAPVIWAAMKKVRDRRDADVAGALREVAAANREVVTTTTAAMVAEPTTALREAAAILPGVARQIDDATARLAGARG